jgi:hypothetical protein
MTQTWMILLAGVGATVAMDAWGLARRQVFGTPFPNYAFVGRWLGRMVKREFRHRSIAHAEPIRGEQTIGWLAHYLIGVAFASLVPAFWGIEWVKHPTLSPALLVGLGTVLVPLFIMQPAMGAGIASSRTPRPGAARLQSIMNHVVFGLGLYASAAILATSSR